MDHTPNDYGHRRLRMYEFEETVPWNQFIEEMRPDDQHS